MDNHGSHLTINFIEYCEANRILPYCFPPHSTHMLQPLDGVPFQQYKHFHGKMINAEARLGASDFKKRDFLNILKTLRKNTFTSRTIRSGFKERGVYPFNPSIVLDSLRKKCIEPPPLAIYDDEPPSSPTTASFSPPKTAEKLRRKITKARKSLQEIESILSDLSPMLTRRLDHIFQGSLAQAELNAQRETDVKHLLRFNQRKKQPRNQRQIKVGGILTVKDANRHIKKRKQDERDKILARVQRTAKRRQEQEIAETREADNFVIGIGDMILGNNGAPIGFIDN